MAVFVTEIKKIINETHDVKTFRLRRPDEFDFVPGEYCLVSFAGENKGENRPFTFSNSPTEKSFIELTIKEMGDFTEGLFSLKAGDKLVINGPRHTPLSFEEKEKNIAFIAGGSGITPFISAIRYAVFRGLSNQIVLFNSNRTEKDIIFKEELESIGKKHRNIKIINILTREAPASRWKGETGRINSGMIKKYVQDAEKQLWYVCGPPEMVSSIRKLLEGIGVKKQRIRFEGWQIPGKGG